MPVGGAGGEDNAGEMGRGGVVERMGLDGEDGDDGGDVGDGFGPEAVLEGEGLENWGLGDDPKGLEKRGPFGGGASRVIGLKRGIPGGNIGVAHGGGCGGCGGRGEIHIGGCGVSAGEPPGKPGTRGKPGGGGANVVWRGGCRAAENDLAGCRCTRACS